ncbi:hypothetical protein OU500_000371 [Yersinia enterocolitica]|uniref:hypothetical protein n=1 Tax=Yersinia enterocolitica TaxID=630 RepID=UPI001F577C55|nr:hypothetical protein [Yersinia enterocolitica]EKN3681988.1 hypothetical protein [Yersinia enterocolitica]HDL7752735.1 hypothetical protein [Yersinia enterocolitica]HDV7158943.1 hypothetical protein [Yersinia enterocolitica]HEB9653553.1 hypothetical protein [Yersinia enterocolitica]HEF7276838.1 hypothetical protein [Yersinia enterocolitica]
MKAEEWIQLGDEKQNPMDKFEDYWKAFNNLFSFYENNRTEKLKINDILNNCIDNADDLLERFRADINYLISMPVINMNRVSSRNASENIDNFNHETAPLDKLKAVFMIIYQIRCNLIHGEKSPTRTRDTELCDHAAGLVREVSSIRLNQLREDSDSSEPNSP